MYVYVPPCCLTLLFSLLIPVVELDTVRFGYLDGDSNFSLVYDPGESDQTLYSGKAHCWGTARGHIR